MDKENCKLIHRFIVIYFVVYLLLNLVATKDITIFSNFILSIIGLSISTIILFKIANKLGDYRTFSFCLGTASLMFLVGDLCWGYNIWFTSTPAHTFYISSFFYLLSNLFIFLGLWNLFVKKLTRWLRNVLIVDGIVLSSFLCYIVWFILFKQVIPHYSFLTLDGLFKASLIISDFLIFLALSILYHSMQDNKEKKNLLVIFLLWSLIDTIYYYLSFRVYTNVDFSLRSILEGFWPTLLLILAYLGSVKVNENDIYIAKINQTTDSYYVEKIPISILFLYIVTSILSYKYIVVLFVFTLLILGRQVVSRYLYVYEVNEQLTQKYKLLNHHLEKKIDERTSELVKKNEELYKLANIDPLTSLPNRRNFVNKLDELISKRKDNGAFALLFIDLDRFKSINDLYGHDVGDLLMVAISQRLKYTLTSEDFVARQSGDEFVALIDDANNLDNLLNKCNKLINSFRQPFSINGLSISLSLSIGISVYPTHSTIRSDLMKYADIALYYCKCNGKNKFYLYHPSMKLEENKKLEIENRLYDCIDNNELVLYYQPQVRIEDEKLVGVEALIRWNNSELGFIPPSEFISIAEDNGFIISIGDWVLEESCKSIKYLNEKYNKNIKIGINVSPKQFLASNLVKSIEGYINQYNLVGSWLDIEITETCSIKNEEETLNILQELKKLGVNMSIDDFGIGYSSLSYLKNYPIDTLKIAMELTRGIHTNIEDYKIVKAIISMCKDLNLNTVAEGIEEKIQVNILKDLGCVQIQGYYYGKPMTLKDLEDKFFK